MGVYMCGASSGPEQPRSPSSAGPSPVRGWLRCHCLWVHLWCAGVDRQRGPHLRLEERHLDGGENAVLGPERGGVLRGGRGGGVAGKKRRNVMTP